MRVWQTFEKSGSAGGQWSCLAVAVCGRSDPKRRRWYYRAGSGGGALSIDCCVLWCCAFARWKLAKASKSMPSRLWWSPLSHGRHGAPLPAPPHTTINKHTGWPLCASASGVGYHGGRCWPFWSRCVDGRCGVVVSCVYIGICRVEYRAIGNTLTMSIIVGIGAISAAASSNKWLFCHIVRAATPLGNDAWLRQRQNKRKKSGRRQFLQQVSSFLDRTWQSPLSYSHHGAPLLAFKHTTISKHTMQQDYIVKTRKNIINIVN